MTLRLRKIRHFDSNMALIAANSGDSYKNYANLMFDMICAKIEEIIDCVNEIIDYLDSKDKEEC